MQILLREWNDKLYVWKEAKYEDDNYIVDNMRISLTGILAVKGGEGGKYVRCRSCQATIENNPEAIEKHFVEQEKLRNCTECVCKQFYNRHSQKRDITKREDGTFEVTETYVSSLRCSRSWEDVNTEAAVEGCMYYQHRKLGVESIGSFLMDHPDLFEKQITVQALKAKGYEYCHRSGRYFVYDMHMRGTMHAFVNEYGIVDHFQATFRNNQHVFYYSATQDKLFFGARGEYREGIPYGWGDTKYNAVKKKIADLYKEDK